MKNRFRERVVTSRLLSILVNVLYINGSIG